MNIQILLDSGDQLGDALEDAPADALIGDLAEPPLYHVHPRTGSRDEVQMEAWVPPEPGFYTRVFVGRVIVRNDVKIELGRGLDLDLLEEADEFLMSMARHAFANHLAVEHAQGRKQGGRAVALVVVCHRPTAALLQRKTGLSAIEGLNLTFLVDAQNEGFLWWIEIESDDIVKLLDKVFVAADLESLDEMGLEVVLPPDTLNARRTDALGCGHCSHAPVSSGRRLRVQRRLNDGSHFRFRDSWEATGTRSVLFQSRDPQSQKALAPQLNCGPRDSQLACDVLIEHTVAGESDNSRPLHQPQRETPAPFPCSKSGPFFGRENDRGRCMHAESIASVEADCQVIYDTQH